MTAESLRKLARYRRLAHGQARKYLPCLAATLHKFAELQVEQQDFEAARKLLVEALHVCRKLAKQRPREHLPPLALTLDNLGDVLSELGRFERACGAFAEAVKIYRQLAKRDPKEYTLDLALTVHSLGGVLSDLEDFEAARDALDKAIEIYRSLATQRRVEYSPHLALALHNLGHAQRKLDQFHTALDCHQEALKIYRALAEDSPADYLPSLALTLASLGDVQNDLNNYAAAQDSLGGALKIYGDLAKQLPELHLDEVAVTLGKLGSVQVALDKPKAALSSFKKALGLCRRLAKERPRAYLRYSAFILHYLGSVQSDLKEFDAAQTSFGKALKIYGELAKERSAIHRADMAFVLTNLGVLLVRKGDVKGARERFEEAATLYEHDPTARLGTRLKERESLWTNFGKLHRIADGPSGPDYGAARVALRKAVELAEDYRCRLRDRGVRNAMHRKMLSPYELLLRTCIDLWDTTRDFSALEEAVHVAESSRARILVERLSEEDLAPRNVPGKQFAKFLRLRRGLDATKSALEIETLGPEPKALSAHRGDDFESAQQVGHAEKHLKSLHRILRGAPLPGELTYSDESDEEYTTVEPEAADLMRKAQSRCEALVKKFRSADPEWDPDRLVKPLIASEIRSLIPTDLPTAFVQFTIAADTGLALILTCKGIDCVTLPLLSDSRCREAAWEWMSSYYNRSEKSYEWECRMDERLSAIGTALLPLWSALRRLKMRRVVLSPSRWLHIFPLHACRLAGGKRRSTDEFEIGYTPSFSLLGRCAQRTRPQSGPALIVGNPTGDLIFTEAEIAGTKRHYSGTRVLAGPSATKPKILRRAPNCWLFHYTGHATFQVENPMLSSLVLETFDRAHHAQWLTLGDAFGRLDLGRCALAVLNGCESGLLLPDRTDDYMALSSGFLHAGAVSVLASLWAVHDLSSALLMDRFHAEWAHGATVAAALREAARWLRKDIRSGNDLLKRVLPEFLRNIPANASLHDICIAKAQEYSSRAGTKPPFASPAYWAVFVSVGK